MNRRRLHLLLPLLLAAACDDSTPTLIEGTPPPGDIEGGVYQRLFPEVPVAGAEVAWGGSNALSDADGNYALSPAATGAESLRVSHPDYFVETRWIELGQDDQQLNFTLLPFDTLPPPAPQTLIATSSEGSFVQISWTAPADSADLAGYWLTKSPGDPQSQRFGIEVNAWRDIAVAPDREYVYHLSSIDAVGNLSPALRASAIVNALPIPSALDFLPGGGFSEIRLRWEANGDADFGDYRLHRSDTTSPDSTDALVFESGVATDTLFTDTNVDPNAIYTYRLYTYDESGQAATHSFSGKATGAAQAFFAFEDGQNHIQPIPGSDRLLVTRDDEAVIYLSDGDGNLLDELAVDWSLTHLTGLPDGRVWAHRPVLSVLDAYLVLVQPEPLAVLAEGELDFDFSTLAAVGNDTLILVPSAGGAPAVLDVGGFVIVGTLAPDLDDLSASVLAVADPMGRQVFFAEQGGAQRLLRVGLPGGSIDVSSIVLDFPPTQLQRSEDGHLLLAAPGENALFRFDEEDFSQSERIDLPISLDVGHFSFDGGQWWQKVSSAYAVQGFGLDWNSEAQSALALFDQIGNPRDTALLGDGSRVVTSLQISWISFCDPSRAGR